MEKVSTYRYKAKELLHNRLCLFILAQNEVLYIIMQEKIFSRNDEQIDI